MPDHSDFPTQGEGESSLQSTGQQQPDRHELPSLDRQSSIYSLTLDDFHCTFSEGTGSIGSMNMDELLNNFWTSEEIQACAQPPVANFSTALNTVSTMAAATININPQVPEGNINTSTGNDINIHQSLPRQGSAMLPAPLSQKTVDEVWSEIQNSHQEPEHVSTGCTANVQKVVSAQRRATFGEMTLEDFLVKAGVIRGQGHPPSALLKESCDYQKNNNTALGSGPSGHVARPVIAINGAGNVPAYPAPRQSSVRDAASVAVERISSRYQPGEVRNGGRRQNRASGGGYEQGQGKRSPPVSPISPDGEGSHQQNSVNQTGMNVDGGLKRNALVDRVVSRSQKRLMKNRESAARSRARKQAYTLELEVELKDLKEEHARLTQAVDLTQCLEEKMKAQKTKDRNIGMRRSCSWPY
ncbi:putative DNA binding protein [Heracleum sosnowskyi]|uniref:DNA binding protein n=1 Tax=Heracleum sosnowskyi TaxID=360622 RepID=A0AAD8JK53_9APIA|nr:putative DNA binding protein [Heracleum sosnowskyi]